MLKVYLSEATMENFPFYYELKCGKSDIYWQGFTAKPEREGLRRCFESRIGAFDSAPIGSKLIYIICCLEADKNPVPVGYIQFTFEENEIELGISIIEAMQGKGVGKAAAKSALELALSRYKNVYVRVRDDNIASWTCFKNAGFIRSDIYEMVDYPLAGNVPFRRWNYIAANKD